MLLDNEQLKIIDFGLARKLTDNVECREMLGTPEFVGMSACMSHYMSVCLCLELSASVYCEVLVKIHP